jgi:hypothetical protein
MSLTRASAIARVSMYCDAQSYPQLSTTDIGQVLDDTVRFGGVWTASTAYSVGDRIVPVTPNGRVYECRTAGTSGTTEPGWPRYGSYIYWWTEDGTSDPRLRWIDMGPANIEQYDVRSATQRCWLIKASRVAGEIDAKDGTSDVKLSQLRDHCVKMAERYRPMVIA